MLLDLLSSSLHSVNTLCMGSGILFADCRKVTGTGSKYCVSRVNTRRPSSIIDTFGCHTQKKVAIEFRKFSKFSFKLVASEFQTNMGAVNDAHSPWRLSWNRLKFDTVHSARGLNKSSIEVSTLIHLKNIRRPKVYVNPTELDGIPYFWSAWVLERRREASPVKSCGVVDNVYQVSIAKVHNICKNKAIRTLSVPLHIYSEVARLNCIRLKRVACSGYVIQLVVGICWQVLKICFLVRAPRRRFARSHVLHQRKGRKPGVFCSPVPGFAGPLLVH
jgi:hypothetical protein